MTEPPRSPETGGGVEPAASAGPPVRAGDRLVAGAVALVREWIAEEACDGRAARASERLDLLTRDERALGFTRVFLDRVMRPESAAVAARQLRALASGDLPGFLTRPERLLLRAGARLSRPAPGLVIALARRWVRRMVGGLVADGAGPRLSRHFARLRAEGFDVNLNLLGETVLGEAEAERRLRGIVGLLGRDDVDHVSVKASSIASQINVWGYDHTLERVEARLRPLFRAAAARAPARIVNLDMEEYRDVRLTVDASTRTLAEPEFERLEAGIALQAYLPESFELLRELASWAGDRVASGGAGIRVRIVKGANLAMERVEAAQQGWVPAPYGSKVETDANFKRMLDWVLVRERLRGLRVGVGSHNLFDVAWAHLLARERGVADRLELEMLQGMAPGLARTVRRSAGRLLLYVPVVDPAHFDSALAYLFRRLEENSSGENFLRHLFDLARDAEAFAHEQDRFEAAVSGRWILPAGHRRRRPEAVEPAGEAFVNAPASDPTDAETRAAVVAALRRPPARELPVELDAASIERLLREARAGAEMWRRRPVEERRDVLRRAADALEVRRVDLLGLMAHEAGKTVAEGDADVSEAVDLARYYAARAPELEGVDGAVFEPLGVVVVAPPWNFPVAIPAGGVFAALAAGNAVVLKPAPQTPRGAFAVVEACYAAGVPPGALHFARCPDEVAGEHLVGSPDVDGIVLTGAWDTADLFRRLAPDTPLFAETSGKNAVIVMPDADLDLAVLDLVRSAFGHAGQKCSAASLAICVGEVARSEGFRRRLVDATRSLVVGPATRPEAVVGPLIGPPPEKLERALTRLSGAERWLVQPRLLADAANLWSPGIVDGVEPGSWFHRTECFGPVLGLVAARDLDEALGVQNGTGYGLTGGIHTLDPAAVERWLEAAEVGNAYVNRAITGAVVQRQPFGGWKRSVFGPGAKAGGPNYVAQLGRWSTRGRPAPGRPVSPAVAEVLRAFEGLLDSDERDDLAAAARSDAWWWGAEFAVEHDPAGLFCESNVFRYRPLPGLVLRVAADARVADVARVLAAVTLVGVDVRISADPGYAGGWGPFAAAVETAGAFAARVVEEAPPRVRLLGREDGPRVGAATYVDDRPVVASGRIELLRYQREQTVSRTRHRFGTVVPEGK